MLPGNAKLRVCFLPFVGSKTAEGLDVSTVSLFASPEFSLRFYEQSVSGNRLASETDADLNMVQRCHFVQSDVSRNRSPMAAILVKPQC